MTAATDADIDYQSGFGNEHASEAEPGVLPHGRNSPQRVAHDLYTEQLTGTAFTMARAANLRTWLYRVRPSVRHVTDLVEIDRGPLRTAPCRDVAAPVAQLRWDPVPVDEAAPDHLAHRPAHGGGQRRRPSPAGCGDPPVPGYRIDGR